MRFPAKEVAPFGGSKVRILPAAFSQEENRNAGFRDRNKSVGEQHIKLGCNPDGYKTKLTLETTQLESDIPRVPRVMRTKTARIRVGLANE